MPYDPLILDHTHMSPLEKKLVNHIMDLYQKISDVETRVLQIEREREQEEWQSMGDDL